VEQRANKLQARVYRVTTKAETVFHHKDGKDSRIRLDLTAWDGPVVVTRANGSEVAAAVEGPALTFAVEPGVDYLVRSKAPR
jgi:hypothetical protein